MAGGASCTAIENGKAIFYDDGEAIIRFHGRLIRMAPHEGFPAMRYTPADPNASFNLKVTPRPGRVRQTEEGSERPMRMQFTSLDYGTEAVDVVMSCGA